MPDDNVNVRAALDAMTSSGRTALARKIRFVAVGLSSLWLISYVVGFVLMVVVDERRSAKQADSAHTSILYPGAAPPAVRPGANDEPPDEDWIDGVDHVFRRWDLHNYLLNYGFFGIVLVLLSAWGLPTALFGGVEAAERLRRLDKLGLGLDLAHFVKAFEFSQKTSRGLVRVELKSGGEVERAIASNPADWALPKGSASLLLYGVALGSPILHLERKGERAWMLAYGPQFQNERGGGKGVRRFIDHAGTAFWLEGVLPWIAERIPAGERRSIEVLIVPVDHGISDGRMDLPDPEPAAPS